MEAQGIEGLLSQILIPWMKSLLDDTTNGTCGITGLLFLFIVMVLIYLNFIEKQKVRSLENQLISGYTNPDILRILNARAKRLHQEFINRGQELINENQ